MAETKARRVLRLEGALRRLVDAIERQYPARSDRVRLEIQRAKELLPANGETLDD